MTGPSVFLGVTFSAAAAFWTLIVGLILLAAWQTRSSNREFLGTCFVLVTIICGVTLLVVNLIKFYATHP